MAAVELMKIEPHSVNNCAARIVDGPVIWNDRIAMMGAAWVVGAYLSSQPAHAQQESAA